MKTLTALFLWVLSSFGGAGPLCELVFSDEEEACAAPPPPEDSGGDPPFEMYGLQVGEQSGARISNGF